MAKENKKSRKHIEYFNPDVMSLEQSHQDFLSEINCFDAGHGYENFNDFISEEADEYKEAGDGVTYVVWNVQYDNYEKEIKREVVAYYTFAATAIPYEDRIRLDDEEAQEMGREFDIEICGISAIEIKMFAVSEKYQDVFFEYEGEEIPEIELSSNGIEEDHLELQDGKLREISSHAAKETITFDENGNMKIETDRETVPNGFSGGAAGTITVGGNWYLHEFVTK